ncbi:protein interacting with Hsp90 1 [[Candida] railenensis]|uniref:Protein interacting with Hsp90 1 n=1 Tax=[Candida] railenensis TaxID=45579 RepID=A0A9P0QQT7_9ASCO|nr:protein interacting with Hsp90 1 [[Candida] railenensis]
MIVESADIVTLNPKEGFVVKTKIIDATDYNKYNISTKVFINLCHDPLVPKPPQDFDPTVVFPLIINNQWEIPIITSREKESKDKKGQPSLVYDCCINSTCFRWCQINADLRSILIEWCIEAVEIMYSVVLEREYSIPKMLSKGELTKTEILKSELEGSIQKKMDHIADETMGLLEEMRENEENDVDLNEELPDIMNVGGGKKKSLIQEIDDTVISDVKKKSKVSNKSEKKLDIEVSQGAGTDGADDADDSFGLKALKTTKLTKQPRAKIEETSTLTPKEKNSLISELVSLEHTLTKQATKEGECFKIHLPTLIHGHEVNVRYSFVQEKIVISHDDKVALEIDCRIDAGTLKVFWVGKEKNLYIFGKSL